MDRKETGRQKETEKHKERERETETGRGRLRRERLGGMGGWGAEGGREDDRTHGGGDKGERKKEKRERTMSAD